MRALKQGHGAVVERGHTVILGCVRCDARAELADDASASNKHARAPLSLLRAPQMD
jgi:hypothetical protein